MGMAASLSREATIADYYYVRNKILARTETVIVRASGSARQKIHRRLDATLAVRHAVEAQRHLHAAQRAQHHRLVEIAEMADAEHRALQLAEPAAERDVEPLARRVAHRVGVMAFRHHH